MYGIILQNYQKRIQNIYKIYHFHIQISYRVYIRSDLNLDFKLAMKKNLSNFHPSNPL